MRNMLIEVIFHKAFSKMSLRCEYGNNKCVFLHMHLAVGYLSCCSHFPLPLFRTRQFTRVWFWSSFLVDCLSCQAPLHSINDTAASHYSLIFNGVEIKIDQIKKSRCKRSSTQKMKLNTLHTKKSSFTMLKNCTKMSHSIFRVKIDIFF